MKRHFTAIVAATCMTTAVSAEGLSYARIDADLNQIDFDSLDVTTAYFNGAVEYITGQFLLSADLIGGTGGFDFETYSVGAGYQFRDGIWIDASYGQVDAFGGLEVNRLEIGEQLRIDHRFAAAQEADGRSGIGALNF